MNKFLKVLGVFFAISLIISIATLVAVKSAGKSDQYKVGSDIIPSIKTVIGDRKVSGVSSEISNGVTKKSYKYSKIENPKEDLVKYVTYLKENNYFIVTKAFDLNNPSGTLQLGTNSVTPKKIVLMDINWDISSYEIIIRSGEGTIVPK